tara:strand:- start:336 stop:1637 length:1302 start_codon:yes stop_codon:yes gene_type:complete
MARNKFVKPIIYTNTSLWLLSQAATNYAAIVDWFKDENDVMFWGTGEDEYPYFGLGAAMLKPSLYNMNPNDMSYYNYAKLSEDFDTINSHYGEDGVYYLKIPFPIAPVNNSADFYDAPLYDSLCILNHNFGRSWQYSGADSTTRIRFLTQSSFPTIDHDKSCFPINTASGQGDVGDWGYPLMGDGFSLTHINSGQIITDRDIAELQIKFSTNHDTDPMPFDAEVFPWLTIGSVFASQSYQFDRSPDVDLSVTYEYDGVKTITGIGGRTFSNKSYNRQPLWGILPPFNTTTPNSIMNDEDASNYWNKSKLVTAGRRRFKLKFSYFSDNTAFSGWGGVDSPLSTSGNDNWEIGSDASGTNYSDMSQATFQDTSFYTRFVNRTLGGTLPFIIRLDSEAPVEDPNNWAMVKIDKNGLSFKQSAQGFWDVSLDLTEVW